MLYARCLVCHCALLDGRSLRRRPFTSTLSRPHGSAVSVGESLVELLDVRLERRPALVCLRCVAEVESVRQLSQRRDALRATLRRSFLKTRSVILSNHRRQLKPRGAKRRKASVPEKRHVVAPPVEVKQEPRQDDSGYLSASCYNVLSPSIQRISALFAPPNPRTCDQCHMVVDNWIHYIIHKQDHFACNQRCWMCHAQAPNVFSHLLATHTAEPLPLAPAPPPAPPQTQLADDAQKPYGCDICHKRFSQQGNLSCHMRIHTGLKPFKCDVCQKLFRHSNSLRRHLRTVHATPAADQQQQQQQQTNNSPLNSCSVGGGGGGGGGTPGNSPATQPQPQTQNENHTSTNQQQLFRQTDQQQQQSENFPQATAQL